MANYFSERNELENKIRDLTIALKSLHDTKKDARQNYLSELARLIKSRPGLTATQYAMLLSDNACERESIRTSIGNMGYVAEHHRKFVTGKLGKYDSDLTPTLPNLKRKEITGTGKISLFGFFRFVVEGNIVVRIHGFGYLFVAGHFHFGQLAVAFHLELDLVAHRRFQNNCLDIGNSGYSFTVHRHHAVTHLEDAVVVALGEGGYIQTGFNVVVEEVVGASVGFVGPVGLDIPVILDNSIMNMKNFIVGANKDDYHEG